MFYMKEKLGAWQVGGDATRGRVGFKLFFPKGFDPEIKSIRVAGDFQSELNGQDWDFPGGFLLVRDDSRPEGTFWTHTTALELPMGFYQYKYLVEFIDASTRIVSDPCSRYGGTDNQNAAFVIGGSTPAQNEVRPLRSPRKPLIDLTVYELMIDDFTDEFRAQRAPLDAVRDKLEYLVSLGFNAILFMPWTAWKNRAFDWGYEPFQFFAVEYRYANDLSAPAEKISWLKKLISECHDRDLHVIMDGVFNHVSVDFPYMHLYRDTARCPFTGQFGGAFPGLQDLNFNNQCTQDFIRDVCLYWMDVFKIDGIRFDNTVNFYVPGDPHGLLALLDELQQHLDQIGEKNFSMTLEHLRLDAAGVTNQSKATSYWDNSLYECAFDYLWNNRIDQRLLNALNTRQWLSSPDKAPTIYLGNHDHSHVTWQAGARDNVGSMRWYKTQPHVIALYTSPSVPMVQNGQEFGEDHWIPEDDHGSGRRVRARPLRWKLAGDPFGDALGKLYRRMGEIRRGFPGLRSPNFQPQKWEAWQTQFDPQGCGLDTARQLAIYRRWGNDAAGQLQQFVIVLNFSDSPQWVSVTFPENGQWTDLLSGYAGTWKPTIANNRLDFTVDSNWGHVFFKQG